MYKIHTYSYNTLLWLEDTVTGERKSFATWEELRRYLGVKFATIKFSNVISHE